MLTLTACHSGTTTATVSVKPKLTQEQQEKIMLMALHHNRDEVLAESTSLTDFHWMKTPEGLLNLECSIALMAKHNEKYPKTPWEVEGVEIRNRIAGPPDEERKIAANACAEKLLEQVQAT